MTTDQQKTNIVDKWLSSTNDSPHKAPLTVARAMARLPQTRQRRNWWPLPLRGRAAVAAPAHSEQESRPSELVAVSGHSPTLTGRTTSMFSPVKIVATGAALALGSALFITQPFDQTDETAPAIQIPATESGPLAEARQRHTATALADGRVLVIGGTAPLDGANTAAVSAEMWDPVTGNFDPAGALAEARYDHTSTLLPDGRVLVIGGYGNDATWLDSAEVWDPQTGDYGATGSLAVGRHRHTATLLPDGRVLVIGGYGGEFEWQTSAEIWDPASGSFTPAGTLAEARWDHDAVLLDDGRVLVVGGAESINPRALAEVWDPETSSFSAAGDLADARLSHSTTLLADGRVLAAGGSPGGDPWEIASVEVWDPATSSFTASGPLQFARSAHSATLLPAGQVLVVGGAGSTGAKLPDEMWDPATGSFSPVELSGEPHYEHTASLLPDGRVLVLGGLVINQESSSSAELVDPAAAMAP
jgi:hypothetical protein